MDWRGRRGIGWWTVAALVLASGLAQTTRADTDAPAKQLTALNRITGNGPLQGTLKQLSADPARAKALVSYAWNKLKDKAAPFSYDAALVLAKTAQGVQNTEAAVAFYRVCTDQAVKLESTSKIVQAFGGLIDLLFEGKRYDEAARVCREVLEMQPPKGRPREVLLAITNRFGEADFAVLESYNSAAPVKPALHQILVRAVAKQGKYEQALKLVDNLLKAQDGWEERELKGEILRMAGKYAEAATAYEDVLQRIQKSKELTGKKKSALEDATRHVLSSIYVDLDQIERATEQLQILVKKNPNIAGYQNDLGYIWADHDMHLEEAEKLVRRALELDRERRKKNPKLDQSENGAYLDSLGWVLYKRKKLKEAREVLEQAVKDKESQHIEIFSHLGDVCAALGDHKAAIEAWRRGLEASGDTPRDRRLREAVERKIQQAKGAARNN